MNTHIQNLYNFFKSGETLSYAFRKKMLLKLLEAVKLYEKDIVAALYKDLGKSEAEAYASEIALVKMEIHYFLKNLQQLIKPQKVTTNLMNWPSASYIQYKPLGVVLIVAPWNYPFLLLFQPLVAAIAAGNCVVLKPSELAPATESVTVKIITEIFNDNYVKVFTGDGATVVTQLLTQNSFQHLFFTGSVAAGKAVYTLAAEKLIPVTLELGGKSPCVIEDDANLIVAARRVVMGKFINAGQTCVAPDYLLVHAAVKDKLIQALINAIEQFYPIYSNEYGKIINEKRFKVLLAYLNEGTIIYGGKYNEQERYLQPTLVDNVSLESNIMKEEIFGPILPIITFNTKEEAKQIIEKNPNPLAFYVFTQSNTNKYYWNNAIAFGGGCINNTLYHLSNIHLPFGGIGNSGIGKYHGADSFYTFSHKQSLLSTPTWFDPLLKYPPFAKKLKWLKLFLQ